jgi:HPt (histidine-containing phosphotransfer) domain-containing protein
LTDGRIQVCGLLLPSPPFRVLRLCSRQETQQQLTANADDLRASTSKEVSRRSTHSLRSSLTSSSSSQVATLQRRLGDAAKSIDILSSLLTQKTEALEARLAKILRTVVVV